MNSVHGTERKNTIRLELVKNYGTETYYYEDYSDHVFGNLFLLCSDDTINIETGKDGITYSLYKPTEPQLYRYNKCWYCTVKSINNIPLKLREGIQHPIYQRLEQTIIDSIESRDDMVHGDVVKGSVRLYVKNILGKVHSYNIIKPIKSFSCDENTWFCIGFTKGEKELTRVYSVNGSEQFSLNRTDWFSLNQPDISVLNNNIRTEQCLGVI